MKSKDGLTAAQEAFARGVAAGMSQSGAYRSAYPKSKKWKYVAVNVNASKMLAKANVSLRVAELQQKAASLVVADAARMLQEAARLALFDPRKLYCEDGSPKPINELDDDTAAAIAGLEVTEEFEGSGENRKFVGYTKKYKVADKNAALEKMFKHFGLYEMDNKQKTDPLSELLKRLPGNVIGANKAAAEDAGDTPQ